MKKQRPRGLEETEQAVLNGLKVRLIGDGETEEYDRLLEEQHYLGSCREVGERQRYIAEYQGEWLALLIWSSGSFSLADRDEWIGWDGEQRRRRLPLVVNNNRYLILEGCHYPNLASRVMKLCLQRLSSDWRQRYGHEVLVAESFVDKQLFRGTAYQVSGWTPLGYTKGYQRVRQEYYVAHDRPKQLWVKELRRDARKLLCAQTLPARLGEGELKVPVRCRVKAPELTTLRECFEQVADFRSGKHTLYALPGLLTLIFCAVISGIGRGQRDLAAYAANLSQGQLRALGFRPNGRTGKIPAPKETTFFRILSRIDSGELEAALLHCQDRLLGPEHAPLRTICIDGKAARSSQGAQLVSAFDADSSRWCGTELVEEKSNEIPAARTLLQRIDVDQSMVLADALHTQVETAREVVQECGAHYVLTVKGNQKGLQSILDDTWRQHRQGVSPPSDALRPKR